MDAIPRCIRTCCITWYGIWYHHLSRYTMRYHTGSPKSPRQEQRQRKPTTLLRSTFCFGFLSLPSSCLVSRLAFFVVRLLPIRWTHHRTDRTTSKHQPCPLVIRPPTWVHDCFCCVFLFSIFPCLFSLLVTHIACYRYRDIPNIFLVVISIRTENIKISHDIPRSLDTIPNSSF